MKVRFGVPESEPLSGPLIDQVFAASGPMIVSPVPAVAFTSKPQVGGVPGTGRPGGHSTVGGMARTSIVLPEPVVVIEIRVTPDNEWVAPLNVTVSVVTTNSPLPIRLRIGSTDLVSNFSMDSLKRRSTPRSILLYLTSVAVRSAYPFGWVGPSTKTVSMSSVPSLAPLSEM